MLCPFLIIRHINCPRNIKLHSYFYNYLRIKKNMNIRKRHQYHDECFHRAVSDVTAKKLNTYQAARNYQVPRLTVFDHIKDRENNVRSTTHA